MYFKSATTPLLWFRKRRLGSKETANHEFQSKSSAEARLCQINTVDGVTLFWKNGEGTLLFASTNRVGFGFWVVGAQRASKIVEWILPVMSRSDVKL